MSTFDRRVPAWFRVVAAVLAAWNAIGCYFCYMQFKLGANAMPDATDYDRALMAALPGWYNWCYALAVGAGLLGGFALLGRKRLAQSLFIVSLIALLIQFGYLFATTDIIAVKGVWTTYFPIFIALVGVFSVWFAGRSENRGWIA